MDPETRYATFRGDKIAYQALGAGPDLVLLTGTLTHVDIRWQEPLHAHFLHRLAAFSRLVLLDPRGSGASDPISLDPLPTWEDEIDDLETVLDALASFTASTLATETPLRLPMQGVYRFDHRRILVRSRVALRGCWPMPIRDRSRQLAGIHPAFNRTGVRKDAGPIQFRR